MPVLLQTGNFRVINIKAIKCSDIFFNGNTHNTAGKYNEVLSFAYLKISVNYTKKMF